MTGFVRVLNSLGTQVWAFFLALLAAAGFGGAAFVREPIVRAAIIGAANSLLGAALLMFRHDAAKQNGDQPPTPTQTSVANDH